MKGKRPDDLPDWPIFREIFDHYLPSEFPALLDQSRRWLAERPLAGMKVLDCTPVFRNTLTQYAALMCAGAEVSVHVGKMMPCDPDLLPRLEGLGVRLIGRERCEETFDCVGDCAGDHADVPSRLGYVELTRTGGQAYLHAKQPVFWTDSSHIKEIETGLGTGDGFRRGLVHLGLGDFSGRKMVLFGCGKVGTGIALHAVSHGADLSVVDNPLHHDHAPFGARFISWKDRPAIEAALREAWCVVTATGIRHALAGQFDPDILLKGSMHVVNLGVEDEYGPAIPEERVLNRKKPLNFILEEPTLLRYIDPTMALQNEGVLYLRNHRDLPAGLFKPPEELEAAILRTVRDEGLITQELSMLEKEYK